MPSRVRKMSAAGALSGWPSPLRVGSTPRAR